MAKGKKTGGRDMKPGENWANPNGRPKLSPEVKAIQNLTNEKLITILNDLVGCTLPELKAKLADPAASVFTLTIGSVLKQALEKGDHQRIEFLLNRMLGKVKEQVEHSGNGFNIVVKDYTTK
jgi:Uma2 family endonuclease